MAGEAPPPLVTQEGKLFASEMLSLSARRLDPGVRVTTPRISAATTGGLGASGIALSRNEREQRLEQLRAQVSEREATVELLHKWGEPEVAAQQEQLLRAERHTIDRVEESAGLLDSAVWRMAEAKALSARRAAAAGEVRPQFSTAASMVGAATRDAMARRREMRRRATRRRKRLWKQEAQSAHNADIRPRPPPLVHERTVKVDEERARVPKSQVALAAEASRADWVAMVSASAAEASRTVQPLPMDPRIMSGWTPRRKCHPEPAVDASTLPPLSSRSQQNARFMEWQRRRVNRQVSLADSSAASPRVIELHRRIADAKTALSRRQYGRARGIVDGCIAKHPKVTKLYSLRSLIEVSAGSDHEPVFFGASSTTDGDEMGKSRRDLLQQALHDAETAVVHGGSIARSHARRAKAQQLLGQGWQAAAAKSVDAALMREPVDTTRSKQFRETLADAGRDRYFPSLLVPKLSNVRLEANPPEYNPEPISSNAPDLSCLLKSPSPQPRSQTLDDLDEIDVTDLAVDQDAVRVAICIAIDDGGSITEAHATTILQYLKDMGSALFQELATGDDSAVELAQNIRQGSVKPADVEKLKSLCPPPAQADWRAALTTLKHHKGLVSTLFHCFAVRDAGRDDDGSAVSMAASEFRRFAHDCRLLGVGQKMDMDSVDRIFVRATQDRSNGLRSFLSRDRSHGNAATAFDYIASQEGPMQSTEPRSGNTLSLDGFASAIVRLATAIYRTEISLSARLEHMLRHLQASDAAKGVSDDFTTAMHSDAIKAVLHAMGAHIYAMFCEACKKQHLDSAGERQPQSTLSAGLVSPSASDKLEAASPADTPEDSLELRQQCAVVVEGLPLRVAIDSAGGLDEYEQRLQEGLSKFGPVHAVTLCSQPVDDASDVTTSWALASFVDVGATERAVAAGKLGQLKLKRADFGDPQSWNAIVDEVLKVHWKRVDTVVVEDDAKPASPGKPGQRVGKPGQVLSMDGWISFVSSHGLLGTHHRVGTQVERGSGVALWEVQEMFFRSNGGDVLSAVQHGGSELKMQQLEFNEFEECIVRLGARLHWDEGEDSESDFGSDAEDYAADQSQTKLDVAALAEHTRTAVLNLLEAERLQKRHPATWETQLQKTIAVRQQRVQTREVRRLQRRAVEQRQRAEIEQAKVSARERDMMKVVQRAAFQKRIIRAVVDRMVIQVANAEQLRLTALANAQETSAREREKECVEIQAAAAEEAYEAGERARAARRQAVTRRRAEEKEERERAMRSQLLKEAAEAERAEVARLRRAREEAAIMECRTNFKVSRVRHPSGSGSSTSNRSVDTTPGRHGSGAGGALRGLRGNNSKKISARPPATTRENPRFSRSNTSGKARFIHSGHA